MTGQTKPITSLIRKAAASTHQPFKRIATPSCSTLSRSSGFAIRFRLSHCRSNGFAIRLFIIWFQIPPPPDYKSGGTREHIKNIYEQEELEGSATVRNFRTVRQDTGHGYHRLAVRHYYYLIRSLMTGKDNHFFPSKERFPPKSFLRKTKIPQKSFLPRKNPLLVNR